MPPNGEATFEVDPKAVLPKPELVVVGAPNPDDVAPNAEVVVDPKDGVLAVVFWAPNVGVALVCPNP